MLLREFERLVKIHGELRVDFKDAKEAVIKEDKESILFSLE